MAHSDLPECDACSVFATADIPTRQNNDPDYQNDMAQRPNFRMVPFLCAWTVFAAVLPTAANDELSNRRTPLVQAVENCRNCVVNLRGKKTISQQTDGYPDEQVRHVNGMGTGVVIDPRGYILTNYHVVQDIRSIEVTTRERQDTTAKLLARDPSTDLAIVKIDPIKALEEIRLGTSSDIMLAESVAAIGNAYGYEHTVTTGIVSALHRTVQINDTQIYHDLIQIDVPINPGNSGGPLLNMDGEVIGINVAVRVGAQGIAFAIPINDASEVAARLMSEISSERVFSGLTVATQFRNDEPVLMVTAVEVGSPAASAGLKAGDQIRSLNGEPVSRSLEWQRAIVEANPGDSIAVDIQRPNETFQVDLQLSRPQGNSLENLAWKSLGMKFVQATESEMAGRHPDYHRGLKIISVRSGSPAESEGIRSGDILVAMHGYMTESFENLAYILEQPDLKGDKHFMFYILRDRDPYFGQMRLAEVKK
ncbi:MAG: trypsin-like peptidase domain-containing protein [Pirellulaceae bacterium]